MAASTDKQRMNGTRRSTKNGGGVIVNVLIGLIMGLLLAAGVAWYATQSSSFDLGQFLSGAVEKQTRPKSAGQNNAGDKAADKRGYGFYDMLSRGKDTAVASAPASVSRQSQRLYLQIGSFEKSAEADNMRARLILNGIEANAQRVQLDDGRVVHRVRVGPFSTQEELLSFRSKLSAAGFAAIPASQPM